MRERIARVWSEGEILRLIRLRTVGAAMSGRAPGPEASVRKALADDHGQHVMDLAKDLAGPWGMLADAGPADRPVDDGPAATADGRRGRTTWPSGLWAKGYLFARALTIGGGTAEVQRNIIAERVLGLPADPRA
jgi:alkylation response protein AidB-like acyl-CoA dehydrogenase